MMRQKRTYPPLLAGFIAAWILSRLLEMPVSTYDVVELSDVFILLFQCIPTFVGGFVAAFLAKRRGWLYGIIVAVSIEVMMRTVGAPVLQMHPWWLSPIKILTGAAGGHLGQLLA